MSTPTATARRLQDDLRAALGARDRATVRVLRTVLAAIANAEAVPVADPPGGSGDGPIAGAVAGLGAAEAPRRELTDADVRAVVAAERDDLLGAAAAVREYDDARAAELEASAARLSTYLREGDGDQ